MTISASRENRHAAYGVLRRLLFLVPPERIHTLVFATLRGITAAGPV
ncbi:MAG: quinone-dependent dihydroorotate dehydrogenase, partial [Mycobacterium sp.]